MVQKAELIIEETFTEMEERWFKRGDAGLYGLSTITDFHRKNPKGNYIQRPQKLSLLQRIKRVLEESYRANYI